MERVDGAPLYRVRNRDRQGRYEIEKEIWADPDSDTIIQKVRITRHIDGLQFFVLHKPAAANSIFGDTASSKPFIDGEDHGKFTGWQGLVASIPWEKSSVGYVGVTDGFTDLADFKMDWEFDDAPNGNVAMMGKLSIPPTAGSTDFVVIFSSATATMKSLRGFPRVSRIDVEASRSRYISQWRHYLDALDLPWARFVRLPAALCSRAHSSS